MNTSIHIRKSDNDTITVKELITAMRAESEALYADALYFGNGKIEHPWDISLAQQDLDFSTLLYKLNIQTDLK